MLAREYCDDIKRKMKPIILSHRMMPGLLEVRQQGFNIQRKRFSAGAQLGFAGTRQA